MKDSDTPDTYKKKGDEFFKEGEYHKAIQYYKKAVELDPNYIQAWNNLGYTFIQLGQKDEAIKCVKKKKELEAFTRGLDIQNQVSGEINHAPWSEDEIYLDQPLKKEPGTYDSGPRSIEITDNSIQSVDSDEQRVNIHSEVQEKRGISGKLLGRLNSVARNGTEINHSDTIFPGKYEPTSLRGRISSFWSSKTLRGLSEEDEKQVLIIGKADEFKDEYKKVILISIIIGICVMVLLLFLGSSGERFTQFYLFPDSIQTTNDSQNNISSFIYGVKSYEHDTTQYQLAIYAGSKTVDTEVFTLNPGETRENKKSFEYTGLDLEYPIKVSIILTSPYQTYDLHYWIKK